MCDRSIKFLAQEKKSSTRHVQKSTHFSSNKARNNHQVIARRLISLLNPL